MRLSRRRFVPGRNNNDDLNDILSELPLTHSLFLSYLALHRGDELQSSLQYGWVTGFIYYYYSNTNTAPALGNMRRIRHHLPPQHTRGSL